LITVAEANTIDNKAFVTNSRKINYRRKPLLTAIFFTAFSVLTSVQARLSGDSLFVNDAFTATYRVASVEFCEVLIDVFVFNPISAPAKKEFEMALKTNLNTKGMFLRWGFSFAYKSPKANRLVAAETAQNSELDKRGNLANAGIDIEKAGKLYNGATLLSFTATAGSTIAIIAGLPVIGTVVSINGAVIILFTQIAGNKKLIGPG